MAVAFAASCKPDKVLHEVTTLAEAALIKQLGDELYIAARQGRVVEPLIKRYPELTLKDAYAIQQGVISKRVAHGEKVIGKKIGVTSQAVMNMLKVSEPDFGLLTERMMVKQNASIERASLLQPKVEGEIAFVLKNDVSGPGVTASDVLRATEGVMACLEVVDSRIRDWKITIVDTVADNASCGLFALGDCMVSPHSLDLSTVGMVLRKNGHVVGTGAGAASMGSPVNAVVWLANTLGEFGMSLKAGDIILSGALSAMVEVNAGDNVRVDLHGIGSCSVRFV